MSNSNALPVQGLTCLVPGHHCVLAYPHYRPLLGDEAVFLAETLAPRLEALVGGQDPLLIVRVKALWP
jgi:hypothetical protein